MTKCNYKLPKASRKMTFISSFLSTFNEHIHLALNQSFRALLDV